MGQKEHVWTNSGSRQGVCVSQRAESDRLVPRRLVDRGAVKGLLTDSDKAELEDTTESKRANDEQ